MNRKNSFFLNLLIYSGVIGTLLNLMPVQAHTIKPPNDKDLLRATPASQQSAENQEFELEFIAPNYDGEVTSDPEAEQFKYADDLLMDDEIGNVAIDLFGCDCSACRFSANNMRKNGMLEQNASGGKWQSVQLQAFRPH